MTTGKMVGGSDRIGDIIKAADQACAHLGQGIPRTKGLEGHRKGGGEGLGQRKGYVAEQINWSVDTTMSTGKT